jgi:hypothetical protein
MVLMSAAFALLSITFRAETPSLETLGNCQIVENANSENFEKAAISL